MERLDKLLAHEGFGTRKDVKKIIHTGAVTVNGVICKSSNVHINEESDIVCVNDTELQFHAEMYIMLNKPKDTVSTAKDGLHKTVFDLLDEKYHNLFLSGKLHLVGRLDIDTEGLLLVTTDGKFTHRLISPKTHISKTYYVELRDNVPGALSASGAAADYSSQFSEGLAVPEYASEEAFIALPAQLEWIDETSCYLTIYEGKYHQVKRMFSAVENKVTFLKRTAIGDLKLDETLELGKARELTAAELELLQQI